MSAKTSARVSGSKRRIVLALSLITAFAALEIVGGTKIASLVIIADAAQMLVYASELALVLFIRQCTEPARLLKPFNHRRLTFIVLIGCFLFLLWASYILYEAYQRFLVPREIRGDAMVAIGVVSLIVNVAILRVRDAVWPYSRCDGKSWGSLLSATFGSLQVVVAAATIWLTGWSFVDPIVAAAIALYMIPRTWVLANEAIRFGNRWRST